MGPGTEKGGRSPTMASDEPASPCCALEPLVPTPPFLHVAAPLQAYLGLFPVLHTCEPVKDASVYLLEQRPHDHAGGRPQDTEAGWRGHGATAWTRFQKNSSTASFRPLKTPAEGRLVQETGRCLAIHTHLETETRGSLSLEVGGPAPCLRG